MRPRILLVDDHPALRRGLHGILVDAFHDAEFGQASDAGQAVQHLLTVSWDIAIVDLNIPGMTGLDLIARMKDQQPSLGVLVYSVHSADHFEHRAVRAGADAYLSKDRPPEQIRETVLRILAGRQYMADEIPAAATYNVQVRACKPRPVLSYRETQVMRMLASGKQPAEIAHDLALSAKTINTYRARMLEKLNLRTSAALIRYAVDYGIVD